MGPVVVLVVDVGRKFGQTVSTAWTTVELSSVSVHLRLVHCNIVDSRFGQVQRPKQGRRASSQHGRIRTLLSRIGLACNQSPVKYSRRLGKSYRHMFASAF